VTVIAPESLDWVTFSEDDREPCDGRFDVPCALEAIALAFWEMPCECGPNPQRCCVRHRDAFLALAARNSGRFRCRCCEARIFLLRMEPLR
jgi:hypothetical protein